ncbi:MAG: oligopeptide ABC transporter permease OppB [Rhodospirillales bacterium]|jgi:oligopeptide transport system permease protein
MIRYTYLRLAWFVPTLFVIITLSFFMMRVVPGSPLATEENLPAAIRANLMAAYHLDRPLWEQYLRYMGNILRGDFGPSFQYNDYTVTELIWLGFPASLQIGGIAILAASVIGVMLGTVAALRQNSWLDHSIMAGAMTGITIPNFVMAPLLTLLFAVVLGWLPAGGWGRGAWANKVLPIVALALPQIAYIARLTRGSMIEVLRSNHVRTARAKGMPETIVVARHAVRGAMLPVVSYLGPAIAGIVTGSVVIERIFGLPGIGRYFVEGALNRDYTLVMGVVIFYAVIIIVMNLIVDLLYAVLDPKVRLG